MIDKRNAPGDDYEDDGAATLAIVGVFVVLVTIAAGVALNLAM